MMIFFLLLSALMAVVVVLDASKYLIPNWLVGLVIVLYPAMVLMHSGTHSSSAAGVQTTMVDWKMALVAGIGMFVAGFAVYALKWMGGGDVKLLAACSLWTGIAALTEFVTWTALFGGGL